MSLWSPMASPCIALDLKRDEPLPRFSPSGANRRGLAEDGLPSQPERTRLRAIDRGWQFQMSDPTGDIEKDIQTQSQHRMSSQSNVFSRMQHKNLVRFVRLPWLLMRAQTGKREKNGSELSDSGLGKQSCCGLRDGASGSLDANAVSFATDSTPHIPDPSAVHAPKRRNRHAVKPNQVSRARP
jgi:hypothetical protein